MVFVVVALMAMMVQACAVSGLSFIQDDRLEIVAPEQNETVTLPFEVDWTIEDYEGSFLVFFDRSPMRPGQSLDSLVPDGDPCRVDPGCPDAAWLEDRNIYVTDATSLMIDHLPDRRDNDRTKDRHDITIVYIDEKGNRRGDSTFTAEFIVERED